MQNNPIITKSSEELVEEYIKQLTPIQKNTLDIAKDHLKTSFNIQKSNGYKEWSSKKH